MNNELSNIPSTWKWVTLDDIGIVVSGGTPSTKDPEFWNGNIPWITPADLSSYEDIYISKGRRNISQVGLEYSSAILLPKNSIVFSSRAPIGYVAIAQNKMATNQGFKNLILPIDLVNPKYVYYYLKAIKELAENMASGTTFLELSTSKFKLIPFPLAPIEEQNKIVEKIEELFSQIKNSEDNLLNSLKSLEKLKFSIGNKFFIKDDNSKIKKIKNIGVVSTGKTPSTINKEFYDGDVNFFKPSDLGDDLMLYQSEMKISKKGWNVISQAEVDSILVTCIGSILGKVGIVKKEGGFNQQINKITVNKDYIPEYILYFCLSQFFKNQLVENSSSTTISIINKTKFENLDVFDVDIEKQREIVNFLNEKHDELKSQEKSVRIELEKTRFLRDKILKQAFVGDLIDRFDTNLSTEELFENIRSEKEKILAKQQEVVKSHTKVSKAKHDLKDIINSKFSNVPFRFEDLVELNIFSIVQLSEQWDKLLFEGYIKKNYNIETKQIQFNKV
ncbi:restriction endonuclease subunit S [Flavobacterium sp. ABG]|uniref:restriction endonuclease subunit S n=1 Tax=Flavobacterium sp. ABG TaxID=1423322 RepID=UPI0006495EA9|nr:restriction endonuclease subunit S [Flavobacterium sp. ABG]KLT69616.1 hypothetical protein AB674_11780 [Flavobacterium sp. ABG]